MKRKPGNRKLIENSILPLCLILYPLLTVRQGLDVSDATYSLANFQYFGSMEGTWMVATFLANAAGRLFMCLPFGGTLVGMYFYTSLVQSLTAVAAYGMLKKRMPAALVFIGEMIALGLCWCPSTILYNYLTYLLMTVGILLLYEGIRRRMAEASRDQNCGSHTGYPVFYVLAGICLGANVAVRMPNVVQAAFILAVWYGAWIGGGEQKFRKAFRDTLWCVLGYLIGFGIPFGAICLRYGIHAYPAMVQTMFAMTEKAADYKPTSMLTGMFRDYVTGMFWLLFAGICMTGGFLLFTVQRKFFTRKEDQADEKCAKAGAAADGKCAKPGSYTCRRCGELLCRVIYILVLFVLLRFYWGKGMFTFQYYHYRSMYYPAVLFLIVAIGMAVACLCRKSVPADCRMIAVLVLIQIFVTPLGSNNYLYPIINNLFVVAPFVLWMGYLWSTGKWKENTMQQQAFGFSDKKKVGAVQKREQAEIYRTVWSIPFLILVLFVLIQSVGFHLCFSFQDGIKGEKRDTMVTAPAKAEGIYTRQDNAAWLSELAAYTEEAGLTGQPVLLYGDIPGLGYLLDMPSALSTFWPSLDSYRMVEYERDLERMTNPPVIMVSSPIAAYLGEDADGMNWFGVEQAVLDADEKLQILKVYMAGHGYQESFGNGQYVVYVTRE